MLREGSGYYPHMMRQSTFDGSRVKASFVVRWTRQSNEAGVFVGYKSDTAVLQYQQARSRFDTYCITKMRLFLPFFLLLAPSHAFVQRSAVQQVVRPTIHHRGGKNGAVALGLMEPAHIFDEVVSTIVSVNNEAGPPEAGGVSYSKASYYTILGLYLLSFPGLWSTIKRSTKAKVKRKTFVTKGEKASTGTGKSLREEAGGIMACKDLNIISMLVEILP